MLQVQEDCTSHSRHKHYSVGLARTSGEIEEAQRLRYRVFVEEMGAQITSRVAGSDVDFYDPYCEHLIVRDESRAGGGSVVGTYRILTPESAKQVGSLYSASEFDLTRLRHLLGNTVEIGRSCIDAGYRNGAVIALLWGKLAEFMIEGHYGYLIGCASVSMADGGHNAANLYAQLSETHLAPLEYRVFPRTRFPFDRLVTGAAAETPPLLKGYLRAGAWICGDPAWDADFNTADFPVLLSMEQLSPRYAKHFVR